MQPLKNRSSMYNLENIYPFLHHAQYQRQHQNVLAISYMSMYILAVEYKTAGMMAYILVRWWWWWWW